LNKKTIQIDEKHVFMIGKYGPVIKKQEGENISFINCRKDLDMDKLEKGEYELEELIEKQSGKKVIGKYKKDECGS